MAVAVLNQADGGPGVILQKPVMSVVRGADVYAVIKKQSDQSCIRALFDKFSTVLLMISRRLILWLSTHIVSATYCLRRPGQRQYPTLTGQL